MRARLAIMARDQAELDSAREELEQRGAEVLAIRGDVSNRDEAQGAVRQTVERFGRIDVLINDAGVIQVGPLENMTPGDFEEAMAVHMWGPLYTMLEAIPHMRDQGDGRIVNVSSIGGKIAVPHLLPYSASKFALTGLSDGMRAELAKDHIKVTTVAPGLMRTGSPVNALFKGKHDREYAWFVTLDSLPVTSIEATRAAEQIVEACRYGDPELTITMQARLAVAAQALFPGMFARAMQLYGRLLPGQNPEAGDLRWSGWESESAVSGSPVATPTYQAAEQNNEVTRQVTPTPAPGVPRFDTASGDYMQQ